MIRLRHGDHGPSRRGPAPKPRCSDRIRVRPWNLPRDRRLPIPTLKRLNQGPDAALSERDGIIDSEQYELGVNVGDRR